jgi:integrase
MEQGSRFRNASGINYGKSKMNATRGELSKLQEAIAAGRDLMPLRMEIAAAAAVRERREPTPPSDGEFYWHPNKSRLGLRVYNSGRGKWLVQYRNQRGLGRTHKIGDAAVTNLSFAESAAKRVLGQIALGQDPEGARQEARARPKFTVAALCDRFFDEKIAEWKNGSKEYAPGSLYAYRSLAKTHLAGLSRMQADEVTSSDIGLRVKEIDAGSKHVELARRFRTMLSSVYEWAIQDHVLKLTANPVRSAWRRKKSRKSRRRALTMEELGAIWRACEKLATDPPRFKGNRFGGAKPIPANSILADDALLTLGQATRQSGISVRTFKFAIKSGELKVIPCRGLSPQQRASRHKTPPHPDTYLITAGELRRFAGMRQPLMRSAKAESSVILRLLMLLGCRYMEIAGLRWSELDLDKGVLHIKTFTAEGYRRVKSDGGEDKDLTIYLPQVAVDLIKTVTPIPGRDHLFGTDRTELTPTGRSVGLLNGPWKKRVDETIAVIEGVPIRKWKVHELRHSFTTHLNEMSVDPRIVESITNHKGAQVTGMMSRYNHATYEKTVRKVLDVWAKTLRNAADRVEIDTSNVTQLFVGGNGK